MLTQKQTQHSNNKRLNFEQRKVSLSASLGPVTCSVSISKVLTSPSLSSHVYTLSQKPKTVDCHTLLAPTLASLSGRCIASCREGVAGFLALSCSLLTPSFTFLPGAVSLMDRYLIAAWQVSGNASLAVQQRVKFTLRRAADAEPCHLQSSFPSASLHQTNGVAPDVFHCKTAEPGELAEGQRASPSAAYGGWFPSAGAINSVLGM